MKRFIKLLGAGAMMICMLSGCSARRLLVLYTSDPIGYLLQRIGGETIDAEPLQTGGTMEQDASLVDNADALIQNADVVFHFGESEPYIYRDQPFVNDEDTELVDLCSGNTIYEFSRYTKETDSEGNETWKQEAWYKGNAANEKEVMERDDCLWNDPVAMIGAARTVKNWLVSNQSRYAQRYEDAYQSLRSDLIRMDEAWQSLADQNEKNNYRIAFAVISNTWTSVQKSYDMEVYPVVLSRQGTMPDEDQLAVIEDRIRRDQVHWFLEESNLNDEEKMLASRIVEDCDLQIASINDLSSIPKGEGGAGSDYLSLMYDNMDTFEAIREERIR
jgi:zinc transport system substrate-binding protein